MSGENSSVDVRLRLKQIESYFLAKRRNPSEWGTLAFAFVEKSAEAVWNAELTKLSSPLSFSGRGISPRKNQLSLKTTWLRSRREYSFGPPRRVRSRHILQQASQTTPHNTTANVSAAVVSRPSVISGLFVCGYSGAPDGLIPGQDPLKRRRSEQPRPCPLPNAPDVTRDQRPRLGLRVYALGFRVQGAGTWPGPIETERKRAAMPLSAAKRSRCGPGSAPGSRSSRVGSTLEEAARHLARLSAALLAGPASAIAAALPGPSV